MKLIYTVGPSGAGKDSVLAWLRQQLPPQSRLHFAQRCITRVLRDDGEQHESMDASSFSKALADGEFVFHWRANQLDYGIRSREFAGLVQGQSVIVNGSRSHLQEALRAFPELLVVQITASPETLRRRLLARARESVEAVEARIERAIALSIAPTPNVVQITNEHTIEMAGLQLLAALRARGLIDARR